MRAKVYVKEYNNRLEFYADEDKEISFRLEINDNIKEINYVPGDKNKLLFTLSNGDIIYYDNYIYPFILGEDNGNWKFYNIVKNKVVKVRRRYLLALNSNSAKRGILHNIQKDKDINNYVRNLQEKINYSYHDKE